MAIPTRRVTVTIRDDESSRSTMTLYTNSLVVTDAWQDIQTLTQALTTGHVEKVEITETHIFTGNPDAGSDVEIKAAFSFLTADNTVSVLSIPAFDRSKLLPSSSEVNLSDGDVANWVGAMLTGFDGGSMIPLDGRAADLTALEKALEQYRPRRRSK